MYEHEDWVHVDEATRIVCENGWITAEELAEYLEVWGTKPFLKKLKKELEKRGFVISRLPKNPSQRE